MMEVEVGPKEQLEEANIEEIAIDGVVPRDGIPEPEALVVHRPVDRLLDEQVGQVLRRQVHQPPLLIDRAPAAYGRRPPPGIPFWKAQIGRPRGFRRWVARNLDGGGWPAILMK